MQNLTETTHEYAMHKAYWLNKFDWQAIPLKTIKGQEGKKQARYKPLLKEIEIAPDGNFPVLFGSYIHELRHAYQRKRLSIVLYWLMLTIARPLLERTAKASELDATQWLCDLNLEKYKKEHGL